MRIWGILSEGIQQAQSATKLILAPQHDQMLLRKNLHEAGFTISDETLVRETIGGKEHFYVIIATHHTGEKYNWTQQEYFLGKYLIEKRGNDFKAYVRQERNKIEAYITNIRDDKALHGVRERLMWLNYS